jgi:hypothetical protein
MTPLSNRCNSTTYRVHTVAQGGDIGYSIVQTMALFYPSACKATHTNFANPNHPNARSDPALFLQTQQTPLTPAEKAGYAHSKWFASEGTGYYAQQTTKPQTIGYSMADSPVGLLAWIYEKLHDWTDSYAWSDDEILTWVSQRQHKNKRRFESSLHPPIQPKHQSRLYRVHASLERLFLSHPNAAILTHTANPTLLCRKPSSSTTPCRGSCRLVSS